MGIGHLAQLVGTKKKNDGRNNAEQSLHEACGVRSTSNLISKDFGALFGALLPNSQYDLWIQSGINLLFYYSRAVRWFPCSSKIHQFEMLNDFIFISCVFRVCSIVSWNRKKSQQQWKRRERAEKIRFNCAQQLNVSRILSISVSFFHFILFLIVSCSWQTLKNIWEVNERDGGKK